MEIEQEAILLEPTGPSRATVLWLHGLGADGGDFAPVAAELRMPRDLGLRFVFPHAPERPITVNGGLRMRAWYDVRGTDISHDEDEEVFRESARRIHALLEGEAKSGIDSSRTVLAGFSQGGAVALYAGLRYPRPLAGLLALSAYLPLPDRLASEAAPQNRETPILMLHGQLDPVVPLSLAQRSRRRLQELDYRVEWRDYSMPHTVCPQELFEIRAWLLRILAPACPPSS